MCTGTARGWHPEPPLRHSHPEPAPCMGVALAGCLVFKGRASALCSKPSLATMHFTREWLIREKRGTHFIFRLASIVLSILGREQSSALLWWHRDTGCPALGPVPRCPRSPQDPRNKARPLASPASLFLYFPLSSTQGLALPSRSQIHLPTPKLSPQPPRKHGFHEDRPGTTQVHPNIAPGPAAQPCSLTSSTVPGVRTPGAAGHMAFRAAWAAPLHEHRSSPGPAPRAQVPALAASARSRPEPGAGAARGSPGGILSRIASVFSTGNKRLSPQNYYG